MGAKAQAGARDIKFLELFHSSPLSQIPRCLWRCPVTCEATLQIQTPMRGTGLDADTLSLRGLGLRMEKPRRESYDLPGGSPPGLPGEGGHWICMLKAEQELAKHTWESYTLGEVWTTEGRNNPSTSPLPPIRGSPGEAGRATVGMSNVKWVAKCLATMA